MKVGAVILAAGFGTRLAPLTNSIPKPLLEVGGLPVATHLVGRLADLERFPQSTLTEIVVVVNDRHPAQWQRWQTALPPHPTVRVISNGVRTAADRVGAVADMAMAVAALGEVDWLFVLAGDNLLDEPLGPHLEAGVTAAMSVVLCRDLGADVPPGRFGEVTVDASGEIIRFREKPPNPESPLAATCSYVLPGSIGESISEYLQSGDADSPGSFVAWLAARRAVIARSISGRYFDIGNHETLAAARQQYD